MDSILIYKGMKVSYIINHFVYLQIESNEYTSFLIEFLKYNSKFITLHPFIIAFLTIIVMKYVCDQVIIFRITFK